MDFLAGEGEAVLVLLLPEGEGFFGEVETFLCHFFAEGVHFDFVIAVRGIILRAFSAESGAFGEIAKALDGEKLGGGVFAGGGEVVDGVENGVVDSGDFFGVGRGEEGNVARGEGFEGGEGKLFVAARATGHYAGVDEVEEGDFGPKGPERLDGDVEAEAFGTRFVNAVADDVVFFAAEPVGDLFALGFGETREGGLVLWFSHMIRWSELGVATGYGGKMVETAEWTRMDTKDRRW